MKCQRSMNHGDLRDRHPTLFASPLLTRRRVKGADWCSFCAVYRDDASALPVPLICHGSILVSMGTREPPAIPVGFSSMIVSLMVWDGQIRK
jgi:hypothetical protein